MGRWPRPGQHAADPTSGAGFALLEVMLGLMILALIAAVVFPGMNRPAGPLALRTAAYALSAMLRDLRTAAIGSGRRTEARIEKGKGGLRVVAGPMALDMPPDTAVALVDRPTSAVSFSPDGSSSGGTFLLKRNATRVIIAVNADTGAIDIAMP